MVSEALAHTDIKLVANHPACVSQQGVCHRLLWHCIPRGTPFFTPVLTLQVKRLSSSAFLHCQRGQVPLEPHPNSWLLVLRHPRSLGRELRGNWSQLKCKRSLKYLPPHLNLNSAAVTVQGVITE